VEDLNLNDERQPRRMIKQKHPPTITQQLIHNRLKVLEGIDNVGPVQSSINSITHAHLQGDKSQHENVDSTCNDGRGALSARVRE
jgi:hypothetical protein